MLGIILIGGTVIAAVVIHLLFSKKINLRKHSILWLVIFSLMTCGGVFLIIWQESLISEGLTRRSWPTVKASVVATTITGNRAYNPKISCRYEVNGSVYLLTTDLHTPGFGRKRSRKQTAEIIIGEHPVGSEILVHYNPDQPDQACIRTGPFWNNYMVLMLGMLVLTGGLLGIMNKLIYHKYQKTEVKTS